MPFQYSPVSLELKDQFYALWRETPRRSLDYTFTNIWGWQEYFGLEWSFQDNLCWIRQTHPHELLWAPVGDWSQIDWAPLFSDVFGQQKSAFTRVPAELASLWQEKLPQRIELAEERGQWEYLYAQEDLANLSGNRFHKKRNHYNSYVKAYGEPDYLTVTPEMMTSVLAMQNDWCQTHECDDSPSLKAENEAIRRVLTHWESFDRLIGGALAIDGRIVAFSVGEPLDDDTLGVHFEKGLQGYKGVYQAMNLQFARNAGNGYKWINRAQDMDEEGLRQAKMTYLPEDFLRKFKVTLN